VKLQTGFPPSRPQKYSPPQGRSVLIQINQFSDRGRHARFGSKADIGLVFVDVRFTPKSGHSAADNWMSAKYQ
jgi:hypothetical protein